jgi:glycosyltransferase involved in cell wall biosynthesis
VPAWKRPLKQPLMKWLFGHVDRFLYVGTANRRLYQSYGVPPDRLYPAPYAVDNARFAQQAEALRCGRPALRRQWGIADDAFCVLFCGKFIAKKRPMDLVHAAERLRADRRLPRIHLLFAGSGELGGALRAACDVRFDAEAGGMRNAPALAARMPATFAGFLNQTEVSRAYVAADALVLPSDAGETWGLVVNEAMASGTPAIASTSCGCAEDMMPDGGARRTFAAGDVDAMAAALVSLRRRPPSCQALQATVARHDFRVTVDSVTRLVNAAG